jgi:hypothetical protein
MSAARRPCHAANAESSARLQAVRDALRRAWPRRLTALDLYKAAGTLNAHSVVDELRDNGYRISCEYFEPPEGGRKRPGYKFEGEAKEGTLCLG